MARQLYRVYLYFVSIALLILAAFGLAILLHSLLSFTSLRGSYVVAPTQRDLVQSLVFAITAWIIAAALGALHIRLIRRDIAENPVASIGGIRSFFLNMAEGLAALVAVFAGASAFVTLANAQPLYVGHSAAPFATAIAALLVVVALEFERRRFPAATGPALVFQRLHTFGVPLILLIATTLMYWNDAVQSSVTGLLIRGNVYNPLDPNACNSQQFGPIEGPCAIANAGWLWLAALIPITAIALYALLARNDLRSAIRTVAHIGSLALGVGALAFGVERGAELLLRGAFGIPIGWRDVAHPWMASFAFAGPLTIGALIVLAYGLWIRAEKAELPPGAQITRLATVAVAAVIFASAFWWGAGRLAYTALQVLGGAGGNALAGSWAASLALMLAGVAYIPLAVYLRRSTQAETNAPRRGFILALLAGGIITGAVGLTMTLYILGTSLLGAPLDNWQQTVRAGLAVLTVGVILVVSYGLVALQERSIGSLFRRLREATSIPATTSPAPSQRAEAPATSDAAITAGIEAALTSYAEGRMSLQEATERIKRLTGAERAATPA